MLKNKRGIVLITTMLTVVLVIMLLSSVVYSNLGGMRLASNFYGREEALMAAQSGIQYAVTRLQDNITWRAAEAKNISETSKGLEVIEKEGNVLGCITTSNGRRSFFRLKFNYEDGAGGLDGLNNSSLSGKIASPYVSVNNLFNSTPVKVYTASADGTIRLKESSDSYGTKYVEAENSPSFELGKASCYLIAEGFAGNSLRDLELDDLAALRSSDLSGQTSVRSEAYLTLDSEEQFTDSVASAASNLTIKANVIRASNAKGSNAPKMRTLGSASINAGLLDMSDGQIVSAAASDIKLSDPKQSSYTVFTSKDTSNFAQVTWESVQEKCKDKSFIKVTAGTYRWEKDPDDKSGKTNVLVRYDGNFPPGTSIPADTAKTKITANMPGIEIDFSSQTMTISDNLSVASNGQTSSFIIRYDKEGGASRPIVAFLKDSSGNYPIITSDNNIFIEGAALGGGSLISAGNISLQGPSILESDPGVGVSVYAKGDVNLLPIEDVTETVKKAEPKKFQLAESDPTISVKPSEPGKSKGPNKNNPKGKTVRLEHPTEAQNMKNDALNAYRTLMSIYLAAYRENGQIDSNLFSPQQTDKYFDHFYQSRYEEGAALAAGSHEHIQGWQPSSEYYNDFAYCTCLVDFCNIQCKQDDDSAYLQAQDSNTRNKFCLSEDKFREIATARQDLYNKTNKLLKYLFDDDNWDDDDDDGYDDGTVTPIEISDAEFTPDNLSNVQNYVDSKLASKNFRDKKQSQLSDLMTRYGEIKYSDQDISGVIYAWGNINADLGSNSTLNLTGAMIAYGGDPSNSTPGNGEGGQINIKAKSVGMTLDPDYMGSFISLNARRKLKQIMFSSF
ncbi:MAG: PilX N-terminal domain-containing pilus assembly protein [Candidatus Bruticola sp.]